MLVRVCVYKLKNKRLKYAFNISIRSVERFAQGWHTIILENFQQGWMGEPLSGVSVLLSLCWSKASPQYDAPPSCLAVGMVLMREHSVPGFLYTLHWEFQPVV